MSCRCRSGYDSCKCGCHTERTVRCVLCCTHRVCLTCAKCSTTCPCPKCARCGAKTPVEDQCDHALCHRCCAACSFDSLFQHYPLTFWAGSLSLPRAYSPEASYSVLTRELSLDPRGLRINRSRRSVAAEIEVGYLGAGHKFGKSIAALRELLQKWQCPVVVDTSLPAGGFEINAAPACGDALVAELTEIGDMLNYMGAGVTDRCGLHVHVDARDFMYHDLQRLAQIYEAVEWTLFAACTPWRSDNGNHYCTPCGTLLRNFSKEKKDTKAAVLRQIYGARAIKAEITGKLVAGKQRFYPPPLDRYATNRRGNMQENRNRYWSLNFHSFFMRGTVECRMRHGSVDATEMVMWARLWASLVDFASATSQSALAALFAELTEYPFEGTITNNAACARAGAQVTAGSLVTLNRAGKKSILTGLSLLSHALPKDVFQWLVDDITKRTRRNA